MVELKSCPFCGGPAELIEGGLKAFAMCADPRCAAEGPERTTKGSTIAAWNRRPPRKEDGRDG